jgi:hypothetical protein
MTQDFEGFMDCIKHVPVSDGAAGEACMVKNGYDPNTYTVDQALTLARAQLVQEIAHPTPIKPEQAMLTLLGIATAVFVVIYLVVKGVRAGIRSGVIEPDHGRSAIGSRGSDLNRYNIHDDVHRFME